MKGDECILCEKEAKNSKEIFIRRNMEMYCEKCFNANFESIKRW